MFSKFRHFPRAHFDFWMECDNVWPDGHTIVKSVLPSDSSRQLDMVDRMKPSLLGMASRIAREAKSPRIEARKSGLRPYSSANTPK